MSGGVPADLPARALPLLRRHGLEGAPLVPLFADASTRRYVRLGGSGCVLMVRGDSFLPSTDPYCTATALYRRIGIGVAAIRGADGLRGLLLLEDLGDDLLAARVPSLPADALRRHYEEAVGLVLRLQREGTPLLVPPLDAAGERLDTARLLFELMFFHRHYVRGLRAERPAPGEEAAFRAAYGALAEDAWRCDRPVLAHRDYHSRNLLVREGRLRVVDHQDSRWGNRLYDLASLLRDPYADLPAGLAEEMLDLYGLESGERVREDAWALVTAQRCLKAAGTYAWQVGALGRDLYRPSLGPALAFAREALGRAPAGRPLLSLLSARGLLDLP